MGDDDDVEDYDNDDRWDSDADYDNERQRWKIDFRRLLFYRPRLSIVRILCRLNLLIH